MIPIFAALLGFISVAFGAFARHGLRETATDEHFRFLMTAVHYNQVHAIVIALIGLALLNGGKLRSIPALKWGGLLFIIANILFRLTIYLSVWVDFPALVNMTSVGGMTIMAAWLLLIVMGVLARRKLRESF